MRVIVHTEEQIDAVLAYYREQGADWYIAANTYDERVKGFLHDDDEAAVLILDGDQIRVALNLSEDEVEISYDEFAGKYLKEEEEVEDMDTKMKTRIKVTDTHELMTVLGLAHKMGYDWQELGDEASKVDKRLQIEIDEADKPYFIGLWTDMDMTWTTRELLLNPGYDVAEYTFDKFLVSYVQDKMVQFEPEEAPEPKKVSRQEERDIEIKSETDLRKAQLYLHALGYTWASRDSLVELMYHKDFTDYLLHVNPEGMQVFNSRHMCAYDVVTLEQELEDVHLFAKVDDSEQFMKAATLTGSTGHNDAEYDEELLLLYINVLGYMEGLDYELTKDEMTLINSVETAQEIAAEQGDEDLVYTVPVEDIMKAFTMGAE